MKRIIIPVVAAFGLVAAAPALAAQDDAHKDHHDGMHQQQPPPPPQHKGPGAQPQGPVMHNEAPKAMPKMHDDHTPPPTMHDDHKPMMHHDTVTHAPPPMMKTKTPNRFDWNNYQQGHTPPKMRNAPKMDFHAWHRNFNAPKHFHSAPYHRPSGWYYRHWMFGMVLPNFFWTRDYWITDYWNYDLPDPPYGYVWVRNGDDALLVSVSSGYILEVVYDLFD